MEEAKKSSRKIILVVCIAIILTCFVLHYVLKASCTGANPVHDYFILSFLPQLGNSGIVFTLLWWFGAPILSEMLVNRKKSIEQDIEESAKLQEAARKKSEDIAHKKSQLGEEKKRLERSYREAAEHETAEISAQAKADADRMRKDAEAAFALQSQQTLRRFENEIRDQAIDRAREEIIQRLSQDAALRDRLIDQSIASLEI